MEQARRLLAEPDFAAAMAAANQAYYRSFVRPDALVRRTVETARALPTPLEDRAFEPSIRSVSGHDPGR